jgi:hypothetical protein
MSKNLCSTLSVDRRTVDPGHRPSHITSIGYGEWTPDIPGTASGLKNVDRAHQSQSPEPVVTSPGTTGRHLWNAQTIQGNGAKPTAEPEAVVQGWEGLAAEWLENI